MDRVKKVREFRLNCPSPYTNHYADKLTYPVRLRYYSEEINNPDLALSKVSSQKNRTDSTGDYICLYRATCGAVPASPFHYGRCKTCATGTLHPSNIRNPLIYCVNRYFLIFCGSQVQKLYRVSTNSFLTFCPWYHDINKDRLHHEIYMSDARKAASEKWKTVIRHPIKKA